MRLNKKLNLLSLFSLILLFSIFMNNCGGGSGGTSVTPSASVVTATPISGKEVTLRVNRITNYRSVGCFEITSSDGADPSYYKIDTDKLNNYGSEVRQTTTYPDGSTTTQYVDRYKTPPMTYLYYPIYTGKTWTTSGGDYINNQKQSTWTVTSTVENEENITVPAGTFNCFKIRNNSTYDGVSSVNYVWIANKMGPVKLQSSTGTTYLKSYSIGSDDGGSSYWPMDVGNYWTYTDQNNSEPNPTATPTPTATPSGHYLSFYVYINDSAILDSGQNGAYIIFLNSFNNDINIQSPDTYTDYIKYDGTNFSWYHREETQPGQWEFNFKGTINDSAYIYDNKRGFRIRFDVNDTSNMLNQWITNNAFTMHIATIDSNDPARPIDTIGTGPAAIINNTINTIYVSKTLGDAVKPPSQLPGEYPNDPVGLADLATEGRNYPSDYPILNFDIKTFQILSTNI